MQSGLQTRPQQSCRRGREVFTTVLLFGVLLLLQPITLFLPAQTRDPVEGIIRVDVGGVVTQDIVVLFAADSLYVPLVQAATLVGLDIRSDSDGTTYLAVDGRTLLGFDSVRSWRIDGLDTAESITGYRAHRETSYVEWQALFGLLGARGVFDRDKLFLRIIADEILPVVARSRRRQIEVIDGLISRTSTTGRDAPYFRTLLGAPELFWRLSHDTYRTGEAPFRTNTSGTFALSSPFMMGQLDVGIAARHGFAGNGAVDWNMTHCGWTFSQPYGSIVTSLRTGSGIVNDRPVIGISITNRELLPRRYIADATYEGRTFPNSEVDLILGHSTVSRTIADSTGRFTLDVPVRYGTTTAIIRTRAGHDDITERITSWNPDERILPTGTVEYHVGAGLARDGSGIAAGDISVRGGISTRWTVHGHAAGEFPMHGRQRSLQISTTSAGLTGWIGRSSSVRGEVEFTTGTVRGGLVLGSPRSPGLQLRIDSIHPSRQADLTVLARLPIGPVRIDGGTELRRDVTGRIDYAPIGSVRAGLGNTSLGVSAVLPHRYAEANNRDLQVGFDLLTFPRSWLPVAAGIRWHRERSSLSEYYVRASAHLEGGSIIRLLATVPIDEPDRSRGSLRIEIPVGRVRSVFRASTGNGMTSLSTTVEGTTLVSPHGVRMLLPGVRGQSSFRLTGYEDLNANGVRDPAERSLGNLDGEVISEGMTVQFANGRIEAFAPFRFVTVEVNRFSLASVGLFPLRYRYPVTTGPGTEIHIDVPFVPAKEVYGRVMLDRGGVVQAGPILTALTAWLTSGSGARFEGEVFSDGTIYFAGVPDGTYKLSFDSEQLDARGICMPGAIPEVRIGEEIEEIEEVVLLECRRS